MNLDDALHVYITDLLNICFNIFINIHYGLDDALHVYITDLLHIRFNILINIHYGLDEALHVYITDLLNIYTWQKKLGIVICTVN